MKSLSHGKVGNIKMRGRKTCSAGCTCCDVQNFKDREREKELLKEILEWNSTKYGTGPLLGEY